MSDLSPEILVIEPIEAMRQTVVLALRSMGHSAHGAGHAGPSFEALHNLGADIVVLCLAGEECLHLARNIRAALPGTGIIMLTAGARQNDKVGGYDSGADIYLTKPVSPQELSAAIHSLARRVCPAIGQGGRAGLPLTLNSATLQLKGPSATVDVSDAECSVLGAFATAPDQRLRTVQLMASCRSQICGADQSRARSADRAFAQKARASRRQHTLHQSHPRQRLPAVCVPSPLASSRPRFQPQVSTECSP
jgi:DNA-binding response OmpR family regulator